MPRLTYKLLILLGVIVTVALIPAKTEAKSWTITDWDVQMRIQEDGSFSVRETRTFDFEGSFSWVETELYKERVENIVNFKVYDENNILLSWPDVEITDTAYSISTRINFSAYNESKTWIFEYKVLGGVGFFEDHDELYWDIIPTDHEAIIETVSAAVILPEASNSLSDYSQLMYVGSYGSTVESYNYQIADGRTIKFWERYIGGSEGVTIVSSWPKGIVNDPGTLRIEAEVDSKEFEGATIIINDEDSSHTTPQAYQMSNPENDQETYKFSAESFGYTADPIDLTIRKGETNVYRFQLQELWWHRIGRYLISILAILVWISPIWAFVYYYRRWQRFGKDPEQKSTIIPQYEPPKGMRPSEMGTLLDEKVQQKDITPMIIDFAVRGYLVIKEMKKTSRLQKTKNFKLLRTDKQPEQFQEYEKEMLRGLFGSKREVKLSDLRNKFYRKLPKIKKLIYQSVTNKSYFDNSPSQVRKKYMTKPFILFLISIILSFVLSAFVNWLAVLTAPFILVGIVGMIFGSVMPRKTALGSEYKWWSEGFKMFLEKAEKYRIAKMTQETFESYFPYAMILGVEKKWAKHFKDLYTEPPDWYVPAYGYTPGKFNISSLSKSLSSFSTVANGSIGSPRSSSSSSSSGFSGGFSGGGGGGGSVSAG